MAGYKAMARYIRRTQYPQASCNAKARNPQSGSSASENGAIARYPRYKRYKALRMIPQADNRDIRTYGGCYSAYTQLRISARDLQVWRIPAADDSLAMTTHGV